MGTNQEQEVVCPFCHEGDFDLEGLKLHLLNNWCKVFNEIIPGPPTHLFFSDDEPDDELERRLRMKG